MAPLAALAFRWGISMAGARDTEDGVFSSLGCICYESKQMDQGPHSG